METASKARSDVLFCFSVCLYNRVWTGGQLTLISFTLPVWFYLKIQVGLSAKCAISLPCLCI